MRTPFVAAAFALSIAPANADLPANGSYFLVDFVLEGVISGEIAPVFTHVEVIDGHMDVTFLTWGGADFLSCTELGKCAQAVQALDLDFTVEGGKIAVTGQEAHTGVGVGYTIWHSEPDESLIITPTADFIAGATVEPIPEGFSLTNAGTGGPLSARFMRASLDEAKEAIALAGLFELPFAKLDHCIVRQITALRHSADRSAAEEEILGAARYAHLLREMEFKSGYWSGAPSQFPGSRAAMQRLHLEAALMNRLAISGLIDRDVEVSEAIAKMLENMRRGRGEEIDAAYANTIAGNEEALAAFVSFLRKHDAFMKSYGNDQDAKIVRLCDSIVINEP